MIDNQVFIDWLAFLKKIHGVNNSEAARESGIGTERMRSLKGHRVKIKPADLRALISAYPPLHEKANEIGFEYKPDSEDEIKNYSIQQADHLENMMVNELAEGFKVMNDQLSNLRKQIQQKDEEIIRLLKIIENLTLKN